MLDTFQQRHHFGEDASASYAHAVHGARASVAWLRRWPRSNESITAPVHRNQMINHHHPPTRPQLFVGISQPMPAIRQQPGVYIQHVNRDDDCDVRTAAAVLALGHDVDVRSL